MSMPVNVAILGGSGFGAGELLRLLVQHPAARVVAVTTTSHAGAAIGDVHPHLRGFYDLRMSPEIDLPALLDAETAVVFSALPHGASAAAIEALLQSADGASGTDRLRIVDLSGDLRLTHQPTHEQHYPHTPWLPERRSQFVYGLPELFHQDIQGARFIANPGCLATGAILATAPLIDESAAGKLVIDAKTGSSGSGRQLKETTHHATRRSNFRAYKPLAHQHEPEVLQALGDPTGRRLQTSFVAQSIDATRGIYITAHFELREPSDTRQMKQRCEAFYAGRPFVRILDEPPELQNVAGSNFCDLCVAVSDRQVVAMAALDNLGKGMSGTAIQNMNLMCDLPETAGLWSPAARPL